jgi:hypothetical protein
MRTSENVASEEFECIPTGRPTSVGRPILIKACDRTDDESIRALCVEVLKNQRCNGTLPIECNAYSFEVIIQKGGREKQIVIQPIWYKPIVPSVV